MVSPKRVGLLTLSIVFIIGAQRSSPPAAEMGAAAESWLGSLSEAERGRAVFPLTADERTDWHYIPRARPGIPLREMTPEQKERALELVRSGLSEHGFKRAEGIRSLDGYLVRGRGRSSLGEEIYYFTVYYPPTRASGASLSGTAAEGEETGGVRPQIGSGNGPWGWKAEGHHLSLNFTMNDGRVISAAPLFMGADPATVGDGELKGLRVLKEEEDWARALYKSFSGALREKVLMREVAPRDIITGVARKAEPGAPVGVTYAEMSREQQQQLMRLIELYAKRLREELAERELDRIRRAGVGEIHFAWAGGSEPGQGHYYRVHGPTFLIEYDNTQGGANHIHSVWRDLEHDFGLDLLREHYATAAHHKHDRAP